MDILRYMDMFLITKILDLAYALLAPLGLLIIKTVTNILLTIT